MSILIPYNQLSDDQKKIIKRVSETNDNLFVEGPPGTGKTLISLYVLRDIATNQNIRPLLMMYNHSLYGFLITSLKELNISENITIATKDKFFWNMAKKNNIWPDSNLDYKVKYDYILSNLKNVNVVKEYDLTVIDEVQDLMPEEWELIKKMSHKVISLGDFDQSIYNTNIDKESVKVHGIYEQLSVIHRFHKKIAKLANPFSKNGEELERKVKSDSSKQPQFIDTSYSSEFSVMADIIKELKRENKQIGVICPDLNRLSSFSFYLQSNRIKHSYYSKNKELRNHDFTSTDPLLISSFSAKGLEFDKVILFGFDTTSQSVINSRDKDNLKSTIFVGITRTKSDLFVVRNEYTINEIKELKIESEETAEFSLEDIF